MDHVEGLQTQSRDREIIESHSTERRNNSPIPFHREEFVTGRAAFRVPESFETFQRVIVQLDHQDKSVFARSESLLRCYIKKKKNIIARIENEFRLCFKCPFVDAILWETIL